MLECRVAKVELKIHTLVRLVKVVPYFGTDEEILALDFSVGLLQKVGNSLTNLLFVLVEPSTVEVSEEC